MPPEPTAWQADEEYCACQRMQCSTLIRALGTQQYWSGVLHCTAHCTTFKHYIQPSACSPINHTAACCWGGFDFGVPAGPRMTAQLQAASDADRAQGPGHPISLLLERHIKHVVGGVAGSRGLRLTVQVLGHTRGMRLRPDSMTSATRRVRRRPILPAG